MRRIFEAVALTVAAVVLIAGIVMGLSSIQRFHEEVLPDGWVRTRNELPTPGTVVMGAYSGAAGDFQARVQLMESYGCDRVPAWVWVYPREVSTAMVAPEMWRPLRLGEEW